MKNSDITIGVITVRGADYPPTRRLAEAAVQRGCRVVPIHPYRLWPAVLDGRATLLDDGEATPLQAVMPRQGAEIKDACLPLISHFEQAGIPVINQRRAIETVRHKYTALQRLAAAGLPVVDTLFITASDGLEKARQQFAPQPMVVKPVSGRQGSGIHRVAPGAHLPDELAAELDSGRGVLCQRYISPDGRKDLRVLVIGDRVAGVMQLTPQHNEFRSNFHLGAVAEAVAIEAPLAELALGAVRAVKLHIAGVDLMVDRVGRACINEVNYSPGFRGLEAATGQDIAGEMIDYVLSVVRTRTSHAMEG